MTAIGDVWTNGSRVQGKQRERAEEWADSGGHAWVVEVEWNVRGKSRDGGAP